MKRIKEMLLVLKEKISKNYFALTVSIITVGLILWIIIMSLRAEKVVEVVVEKDVIKEISYEIELVKDDLISLDYNEQSILMESIVSSIKKNSQEYDIPIGLLHAIFRIESEYKSTVIHPNITVRGKSTNAIGLGGIVWEYWSKLLIENKIAFDKKDLLIADVNIKAAAFILNYFIEEELNKNNKISIEQIIRRYYGAMDQDYYNKMVKNTSDLWLKRISKDINRQRN
jgi:hypothetical protein